MDIVRSRGVTIFGCLLILGCLYQMGVLFSAGYGHYSYLNQEYPPEIIFIRWIVSWVIRITGLIAGIGILKLKDVCRKFAILSSFFTVVTVHLKHSYPAYALHMKYLDASTGVGAHSSVSFVSLTWPALIAQRCVSVIFGVLLIYFFTHPEVRKQFQK